MDSEGAQLRNVKMREEKTTFSVGEKVTIHFDEIIGDSNNISFNPKGIARQFIIGDEIKIIGVGGVDSGISAYKKFLAGASYVQLYTGMVYRGPNIVNLIKKELKELLLKDGVKHYSEIIGKKTIS